jgi:hypothetical protein
LLLPFSFDFPSSYAAFMAFSMAVTVALSDLGMIMETLNFSLPPFMLFGSHKLA